MKGFENMDSLLKKFSRMENKLPDNMGNILLDAAITLKGAAQRSIQEKSSGGAQFRYRNGVKRSVMVSRPGDPPNSDTGRLVRSIKARKISLREAAAGIFGQDAPYGKWLEFGTHKMEARPWLRPAFHNSRKIIEEKLKVLGKKFVNEVMK